MFMAKCMDGNSSLTHPFIIDDFFYRTPSREALELAKSNVLQYYSVVGVLEEYHQFFVALDCILPEYFSGAYAALKRGGKIITL